MAWTQHRCVTVQDLERSPLTVLDVAAEAATAPQFPNVNHWWVKVVHGSLELRTTSSTLAAPMGRSSCSETTSAQQARVRAGHALRRTLLTAQVLGLRGEVLAGPIELSGARVRDIPGAGVKVVLEVRPFAVPEA